MARSLGLTAPQGVVITDVWPGGPGTRAGLALGDVIVSVDGHEVDDDGALNFQVGALRPGAEATLTVRRNGAPARTVVARVEAPSAVPAADAITVSGRNPLAGATVVNFSPAAAIDAGVDPFSGRGVMVTKVDGGMAQNLGLKAGDFIREINGRPINATADLAAAVRGTQTAWALTIERNGQRITAQFSGG
jgi:S1-C subfamily serine protease